MSMANVAIAIAVIGIAVSAVGQASAAAAARKRGAAQQKQLNRQAEQEEVKAREREIDRRKRLLSAMAQQTVEGAAGGKRPEGSQLNILRADFDQYTYDRDIDAGTTAWTANELVSQGKWAKWGSDAAASSMMISTVGSSLTSLGQIGLRAGGGGGGGGDGGGGGGGGGSPNYGSDFVN
jgi:hypothetical protein